MTLAAIASDDSLPAAGPDFHEGDNKLEPLKADPELADGYSAKCLAFLQEYAGGALTGLRMLDVGCGRGDLVLRLRGAGARAFGVEIESRYLESGKVLNQLVDEDGPILSVIEPGARYPYPDGYFDMIASFVVLEHVADLDALAAEIARVLRPGARTIHLLPSKYRPVEPHYFLPLVHWLPKNRTRKLGMAAMLRLGFGRNVMRGHDRQSRLESIYKYANEETFYRTPGEVARAFAAAGLTVDRQIGARVL